MKDLELQGKGLLAELLRTAGAALPMPCGGKGSCGKCAVFVRGAVDAVSAAEQQKLALLRLAPPMGYALRLACFCTVDGVAQVLLPEPEGMTDAAALTTGLPAYDGAEPAKLGCAVDIGTTCVTLALFALGSGALLATRSAMNRQAPFGADVLSRIAATATQGVEPLHRAITGQLRALLGEALAELRMPLSGVERFCVTGNTTMLHLLTGRSVQSIGVAPFAPETHFGYAIPAETLFPGAEGEVYLPPAVGAYVGPDIVCGLLATGLLQREGQMLIDVGTNGEMALYAQGKLLCCATAAGPVFEGAGISCGMPALPGAVHRVRLANGSPVYATLGGAPAKGICGTGLIDLVGVLLDLGLLEETGLLEEEPFAFAEGALAITQQDVRNFQLAKAAICAGAETLLHESGLPLGGVRRLLLSGGFGSALPPASAAKVGLIPRALAAQAVAAGNTALAGAMHLALSKKARAQAMEIASSAVELSLATHPFFMDRYIENMLFEAFT